MRYWRGPDTVIEALGYDKYNSSYCLQEINFDEYLRINNPKLLHRLTYGEIKMSPQNNKKITKKFYVGSPRMNPLSTDGTFYHTWAKSSLEAAVEAAKEKCEETGEPQIVVQIVRVVRPQKQPIVVEKV